MLFQFVQLFSLFNHSFCHGVYVCRRNMLEKASTGAMWSSLIIRSAWTSWRGPPNAPALAVFPLIDEACRLPRATYQVKDHEILDVLFKYQHSIRQRINRIEKCKGLINMLGPGLFFRYRSLWGTVGKALENSPHKSALARLLLPTQHCSSMFAIVTLQA